MRQELEAAQMQVVQLDAEVAALTAELEEVLTQYELQKEELERFKKAIESATPNRPERTVEDQLQLGWVRVLAGLTEEQDADDDTSETRDALGQMKPPGNKPRNDERAPRRGPHGRRGALDLAALPVLHQQHDPPEVVAADGEGFRLIGEETSSRIGYRPATHIHIKVTRRKWARIEDDDSLASAGLVEDPLPPVIIADMPECFWPRFMADPSAIANVIVTKYGDVIPLHRQETISKRSDWPITRSTLCNWLKEAHRVLYRVADAMLADARKNAFCIATDATGAPVKAAGGCESWHVFVLIADRDHVVFQHTKSHDGAAVTAMLDGFQGYVLADASAIYDTLYRDRGMTEAGCWSHQRRYFWKALETEPDEAYEALSLISQLFAVERDCKGLALDATAEQRQARAGPILDAMDRWVDSHRDQVDPGGRIHAAITYYENQRDALRAFLKDPRLPIHNNFSELQLRNLVLGRSNWMYFAHENGLKWYTVFRSLIASCALHDLNPEHYLEQVLRLAPHWPISRMLELSPKYWRQTLEDLDERQRAIVAGPWELESRLVATPGSRVVAA